MEIDMGKFQLNDLSSPNQKAERATSDTRRTERTMEFIKHRNDQFVLAISRWFRIMSAQHFLVFASFSISPSHANTFFREFRARWYQQWRSLCEMLILVVNSMMIKKM